MQIVIFLLIKITVQIETQDHLDIILSQKCFLPIKFWATSPIHSIMVEIVLFSHEFPMNQLGGIETQLFKLFPKGLTA